MPSLDDVVIGLDYFFVTKEEAAKILVCRDGYFRRTVGLRGAGFAYEVHKDGLDIKRHRKYRVIPVRFDGPEKVCIIRELGLVIWLDDEE